MSFGTGGFFGSGGQEKKTTTVTTETTTAQDQRVQMEGDVGGGFVGPGAVVSEDGAVQAGPYASVSQAISSVGMSGGEVRAMLNDVFRSEAQGREALTDLASSLGSGLSASAAQLGAGLSESTAQLGKAISAVKAPEQTTFTTLMPLLGLGLILFFLLGK